MASGEAAILLFYRQELKRICDQIARTDRRDPNLNSLYKARNMILDKIERFDELHGDIPEALMPKNYGDW